jgi:hypothetical protein
MAAIKTKYTYCYPCMNGCKTKKGKPKQYRKKSPYPSRDRLCAKCYGEARERYNNELLYRMYLPILSYACTQATEEVGPLVSPHGMTRAEYNKKLASNKTDRRYVDGSRYYGKDVDERRWKIIKIEDVVRTRKMKLVVKTDGDATTTVEVATIMNSELSAQIEMAWRDADEALRPENFSARKDRKDEGNMAPIGRRRKGEICHANSHAKSGQMWQHELYAAMLENEELSRAVSVANQIAKKYCIRHHPELVEEFAAATKNIGAIIRNEMGGDEGLSPSGAISHNLGNSSHKDVFDQCRGVSTWIERKTGMAKGVYFLMPNTSIDGDGRPIAIELGTGITIVWDGRILFHCTSVGDVGEDNAIYGNFLGVSGPTKYISGKK